MNLPVFTVTLLPGQHDPNGGNPYSFAWRTFTSPTTPGIPAKDPDFKTPQRAMPYGQDLWIAWSFWLDQVTDRWRQRILNFHTIGGYPGWDYVSALAVDVKGEALNVSFAGAGKAYSPALGQFTGAGRPDLEAYVPAAKGVRHDLLINVTFQYPHGKIAAWLDGKLIVGEFDIVTSYPPPTDGTVGYGGQGWEGAYVSEGLTGDTLVTRHTPMRVGRTLAECLADLPQPTVNYWRSAGTSLAAPYSSSVLTGTQDVSGFVLPAGMGTATPPVTPPVAGAPTLEQRVAVLEQELDAVKAVAKAMGGNVASFAHRVYVALGGK